ncbi:hypothetical protein J4464_01425 [Candidatus Woesearchaeota archaeon]|nr:hypothetical protein [Candidatus Woesearchaeota archaeon]
MLEGIKKIHFIGVAGVAMSAIAIELKDQGFIVTGSDDEAYDPVKTIVEKRGILKKSGYDATFITDDIDLVVLGRHAFLDNPEYVEAKKKNIKIVSFPELLEDILKDYTVICVVGTYAKTTITAIITWILETAGEQPSYLIGGIPKNLDKSFRITKSKYFVIEGDEYPCSDADQKPKFMYYHPDIVVLTSAELDHINVYPTDKEYQEAYVHLFQSLKSDAHVIVSDHNKELSVVLTHAEKTGLTYGLQPSSAISARHIIYNPLTTFDVLYEGKSNHYAAFLYGEHNVENMLAGILVAKTLGIPDSAIEKALRTFRGTQRRQEIVYKSPTLIVIDDLAHQPSKVRETVRAVKQKFPHHHLIALFEPYTGSSRNKRYVARYMDSFNDADEVIIYRVQPSRLLTKEQLATPQDYARILKHPHVQCIETAEVVVTYLKRHGSIPTAVLFMSSSNFEGALQKYTEQLPHEHHVQNRR